MNPLVSLGFIHHDILQTGIIIYCDQIQDEKKKVILFNFLICLPYRPALATAHLTISP